MSDRSSQFTADHSQLCSDMERIFEGHKAALRVRALLQEQGRNLTVDQALDEKVETDLVVLGATIERLTIVGDALHTALVMLAVNYKDGEPGFAWLKEPARFADRLIDRNVNEEVNRELKEIKAARGLVRSMTQQEMETYQRLADDPTAEGGMQQ